MKPEEEDAKPAAWMHPDGRVIPAKTMIGAIKDGGAIKSSLSGYTIPLYDEAAIRAAVAHERGLAAKVIRETTANVQNDMMAKLYSIHHVDGAEMLCDKLLVAIKDDK